jgi:hypothetical protein
MNTAQRDCEEVAVLTTYFNSANYASRKDNYLRFIRELERSSLRCLTVECAFGDQPYVLPVQSHVTRLRTPAILWQKERLLNAFVASLPPASRKVAWIDADLLFENPAWYQSVSRQLEQNAVVQLFDSVVRLPRGCEKDDGNGEAWTSFALEHTNAPGCERLGWFSHGHTGFAWAARRELFDRCGLFDLCLTGSADHLMAHAFVGDFDSRCIDNLIGLGSPLHREFVKWATEAYRVTEGRIGYVEGRILHLWHGDTKDRRYHERSLAFKKLEFVPSRDIRLTSDGCWDWTGANPALEQWAADLFYDRMEDGGPSSTLKILGSTAST